ncbi:MAG: DUF3232 domain-containing protein [Candidatus Woesearchaeota archaeon]
MGLLHKSHKPIFYGDPEEVFHCSEKEKDEALKRYKFFKTLFEDNKDKEGERFLTELKDNCARYIEAVVNFEVEAQALKKGKITKKDLEETDRARKSSHDALISDVTVFNRFVAKKYGWQVKGGQIPPGGIFSLDPLLMKDRKSFTRWAFLLVSRLFRRECNKGKKSNFGS